jgi:hypothetical protein
MGSGGSDQRTQFLAICLFGQTAAFNDVYNLMSLGDLPERDRGPVIFPIPLARNSAALQSI